MKKLLTVIVIVLVIAALVFGIYAYSGRDRTLADILPEELGEDVMIWAWGSEESVKLTKEQIDQLQGALEQLTYKKVGVANGMGTPENYGNIIYEANGKTIELMLSNQKGGRILVNVVDESGEAPVYQMKPNGEKVEALVREFLTSEN